MNGLRERRKNKSRLQKIVEKWEKFKKREKWPLFKGFELYLCAEMRKKMTWAIFKYCNSSSVWNRHQNRFGRSLHAVDQFFLQFWTAVWKKQFFKKIYNILWRQFWKTVVVLEILTYYDMLIIVMYLHFIDNTHNYFYSCMFICT